MRSRLAAVLVLVSLAMSLPVAAATDEPRQPTIEIAENADSETLTYGIAGTGWIPGTLVQLELCGNNARGGSVDCALGTAQIVAADSQGQVRGRLSTSPPPSLCPCVVRAVSLDSYDTATTPVRVPGVAELPADAVEEEQPPPVTELTVRTRLVEDGSPWGPWIGTAPKRKLVVMIANTGGVPVDDAVLSVTVGRSDPPTGFVEPVALGAFDVDEVREVEVPVELPAFTWGGYQVHGEITGATEPVEFTESTSSYPWLLIVLAIFAVAHFALVLLRRAIRKRLPDDPTGQEASMPTPPGPETPMLAIGPSGRVHPSASGSKQLGADLVYVVEVAAGQAGDVDFEPEITDRLVHEYRDVRRDRVVYTVLGFRAAKALIAAVLRTADDQAFPPWHQRRIVEVVSIPPIVTASEEEIRDAGSELGRWLGCELGFDVHLPRRRDRNGVVAIGEVCESSSSGVRLLGSMPSWLRLEFGVPTATYRLACDPRFADQLDEIATELRTDGVHASVDHSDVDSEIAVRSHHLDALVAVCERIEARVPIDRRELSGLIPLRMVNGVGKQTVDRLGIEAADTFEYQIIAMADTRRLTAVSPSRSAGTTLEPSASWDAPRGAAPVGSLTMPRPVLSGDSSRD